MDVARKLTLSMVSVYLPERHANGHKGLYGSVAVIGGDRGMVGAALLSARSALRCGAGRVYTAMLCKNAPSVDVQQPEIMLRTTNSISQLQQLDTLIIGPGLGSSTQAVQLLEYWLEQDVAILLDADALNLIASHMHLAALVVSRRSETVITPHVGEASRLLNVDRDYIEQSRADSALKLAHLLRATCVLKGPGTICAHHAGVWFINTTGNVGLASAGTGDVLSGVIGSLMAQGLNGLEAAKLGVYVHGAAADTLVKKGVGPIGLSASEVLVEVRNQLNQMSLTVSK